MKMKKIIIVLFTVFISKLTIAQMPNPPQPNGNIINSSLDKFIGTWMWTNGSDTLKIVLKKENILLPFPENSRADVIVGFHILKQGNNIIESSIDHVNTSYADKKSTILVSNSEGVGNPNEIGGSVKNISKNKSGQLTLVINSSLNQLSWALKNREGLKIGDYDYTFSYPLSLTLQKQ
jgi:hypothetical protein